MKWWTILYFILLNNVFAEEKKEKTRVVVLEEGAVVGTKYWDGDFYEFFGIPYAEAPTGRDRYQAPLPVKPWQGVLSGDVKTIVCHQSYYTEEKTEEFIVSGDDDCLLINLHVPEIASTDNLVPVVVYIHSGAYAGGNGHMARFHYLARHDIIVISFNYRLGALGFACLGNKEIPGNAGMKDQVAALKWIKKNVAKFGGDPNKITLAGYSVGATMAELLSLSKTTDGLIDQLILDSASALSPFAINRDPVGTAKNLAYAMGYNGTANLEDLTEFYLNATVEILAAKSLNFFLPNSTFGFAPCIENVHKGIVPFLTKSPIDIMRKGQKNKIPVLIGFANMEGISRTIKFGEWREKMTEDFSEFVPVDLVFDDEETKQAVIKEIKTRYFKGNEINHEKLQNYIDYFSDAMFKYSIMKSLKLRAAVSKRKMYLYEFNYVGKLNMQHNYMDRIKGASHRDQTAYILDFFGWTNSYKDLDMRDRMSVMWADFVKYGDPTAYESAVVNYKWLPYTNENQNYLQINKKPTMKKNLFTDGYNFWDKLYQDYYWNPTAPKQPRVQNIRKKQPAAEQEEEINNNKDNIVADTIKPKVDEVKEKENPKVLIENNKKTNQGKEEGDKIKKEDNNMKQNNVKEKVIVEKASKDDITNEQVVKEKIKEENVKNKETVKKNKQGANKIVDEINKNNIKEKDIVEEVTTKQNKDQQVVEENFKKESIKNKQSVKENNKKRAKENKESIKIANFKVNTQNS